MKFVDWSSCQEIWKQCSEKASACGCFGTPTLQGFLAVFIIAIIIFLIIWRFK